MLVAAAIAIFAVASLAAGRFTNEAEPAARVVMHENELPPEWGFVEPALAGMRATAIRVCGQQLLVAASTGLSRPSEELQLAAIVQEYERQMVAYNDQVGATFRAGNRRPWSVPAVAPPLEVTQENACLKAAAMPPEATRTTLARTAASGGYVPDPAPLNGNRYLTPQQLDQAALEAGWPMEPGWWPEMRLIVMCESGLDTMAHNTSDPHGGSYGLAQLNGSYHFENAGEDFAKRFDPVVNLRTALWLRTVRGHFGGTGGWYNCAIRHGIN
ncbi:MAG: hypothetical protein IT303_18825 [Dehalococcoidia bacterium]|nr:hypothetical protein [Dehalococcoidia bacterium]